MQTRQDCFWRSYLGISFMPLGILELFFTPLPTLTGKKTAPFDNVYKPEDVRGPALS